MRLPLVISHNAGFKGHLLLLFGFGAAQSFSLKRSLFHENRNRIDLGLHGAGRPPARTRALSRSFSRLRATLHVLAKGRPRPIDPVPRYVQSQSILPGSRLELSNLWCLPWRARRGPRWEAAASARREAKRSNRPGYHIPSMARQRGGGKGDFVLLRTIPPSLDLHLLRGDNSFAGASSTTQQARRLKGRRGTTVHGYGNMCELDHQA